jgi:hypothetical protein
LEYSKRWPDLGYDCRIVGHGDTIIAIDLYLRNKGSRALSGSKLLEYIRKRERWDVIVASSPLIVCLYLDKAETIIYVSPVSTPNLVLIVIES